MCCSASRHGRRAAACMVELPTCTGAPMPLSRLASTAAQEQHDQLPVHTVPYVACRPPVCTAGSPHWAPRQQAAPPPVPPHCCSLQLPGPRRLQGRHLGGLPAGSPLLQLNPSVWQLPRIIRALGSRTVPAPTPAPVAASEPAPAAAPVAASEPAPRRQRVHAGGPSAHQQRASSPAPPPAAPPPPRRPPYRVCSATWHRLPRPPR
jgi:hypothetical protein